MTGKPVEWVLVVYYGPSAHRATYGRQIGGTKYTKDYIQLSKKPEFLDTVARIFPVDTGADGSVPLTYRWPLGTTAGAFVFNSADRPHLKWETSLGAPSAWKMRLEPNDSTEQTIPGDPTKTTFDDAEGELQLLSRRGGGQPYLVAVKLRDEPNTLHVRAYLAKANASYEWASTDLLPLPIQELAFNTSQTSALAWGLFTSGGTQPSGSVASVLASLETAGQPGELLANLDRETGEALGQYLARPGYGLFFDPAKNHDAWSQPSPLSEDLALSAPSLIETLKALFPTSSESDIAAEDALTDADEVQAFHDQIEAEDYGVPDATATVKTRGSAQRAFANAVKQNYGFRCAVTGISTREFLVASHIVPWSEDASVRLDPTNGICLSLLVDRAFEKGFLLIEDDLKIRIDADRVGDDNALLSLLAAFDGAKLTSPSKQPPRVKYLQRRRELF